MGKNNATYCTSTKLTLCDAPFLTNRWETVFLLQQCRLVKDPRSSYTRHLAMVFSRILNLKQSISQGYSISSNQSVMDTRNKLVMKLRSGLATHSHSGPGKDSLCLSVKESRSKLVKDSCNGPDRDSGESYRQGFPL